MTLTRGAARPPAGAGLFSGLARPVGVEIACDAVRASRITRSGPVFASVPLPAGAVRHGEILEPDVVRAALRELWTSPALRTKRVVVGLNSRDVVTRVVEMPRLGEKDLRSALRYELDDLLPFAVDDAVVEHLEIEDSVSEDGQETTSVLAVAARTETVDSVSSVVSSAGLQVVDLDLTALALARVMAQTYDDDAVDGIISLGEDSLTIVVHQREVVRFCRTFPLEASGDEQWSDFLDELRQIEQYRAGQAAPSEVPTAADAVLRAIAASLEYYSVQAGAVPISRYIVLGEGVRCRAIASALEGIVGMPVETPDPLAEADGSFDDHGRADYVAAYGLALQPVAASGATKGRLDLRPHERAKRRSRALLQGGAVACVVTALLLWLLTPFVSPDAAATEDALARARARQAAESSSLRRLASAASASKELDAARARVVAVNAERVDWARVLQDIRASIPAGTEVSALVAQGPTQQVRGGRQPGTIQLTARTGNPASIATWLSALGKIAGLRQPWLSTATAASVDAASAPAPTSSQTTFTITADLDDDALVTEGTK